MEAHLKLQHFLLPLLPTRMPLVWESNILALNHAETGVSDPVYSCHIPRIGRLEYSVQTKFCSKMITFSVSEQSRLGLDVIPDFARSLLLTQSLSDQEWQLYGFHRGYGSKTFCSRYMGDSLNFDGSTTVRLPGWLGWELI